MSSAATAPTQTRLDTPERFFEAAYISPGGLIGADGIVPDGTVPDGIVPDGIVPDGIVPDGIVPDGNPPPNGPENTAGPGWDWLF